MRMRMKNKSRKCLMEYLMLKKRVLSQNSYMK
jgi:hypothetical protein